MTSERQTIPGGFKLVYKRNLFYAILDNKFLLAPLYIEFPLSMCAFHLSSSELLPITTKMSAD